MCVAVQAIVTAIQHVDGCSRESAEAKFSAGVRCTEQSDSTASVKQWSISQRN